MFQFQPYYTICYYCYYNIYININNIYIYIYKGIEFLKTVVTKYIVTTQLKLLEFQRKRLLLNPLLGNKSKNVKEKEK